MTRSIEQLVEEQARRWRLEQAERNTAKEKPLPTAPPNVVTISNAFGSQATGVGHRVGTLLEIPVYDREITEHIATNAQVKVETVATLDQRAQGILDEYISALFRERSYAHTDYLHGLSKTITALWRHGPCVLIGHGSTHIVDRRHALRIRITAPEDERIRRVQELEQLDKDAARKRVRQVDAERAGFHKRCFRADVNDPLNFDIVLNCEHLPLATCATLIASAYREKFASPTAKDLVDEEWSRRLSIPPHAVR